MFTVDDAVIEKQKNDPRTHTNKHEKDFVIFREISWIVLLVSFAAITLMLAGSSASSQTAISSPGNSEYLWYEAEDMRGFATQPNGEPILNPSWQNPPKAKAPGWGMNGTGTSAEWSMGGASEWGSAAASADETQGTIYQDIEVPRAGDYRLWVRYADWTNKAENFVVRITQNGREASRHEFGTKDLIDRHDELAMYWEWVFMWDSVSQKLEKGPARVSIDIEKASAARRHLDSIVLTNDLGYVPEGRRKPDFAAMRYLREWSISRSPLSSLAGASGTGVVPISWQRTKLAGSDFLMPWNISTEFWKLYDKPPAERPLYPFNAEPIEDFVQKYKGTRDVPLFSSKLVVPVIYINNLPEYFKEGSAFLRYLREAKAPFAILINYGAAAMTPEEGQAAWKLLTGEFRDQFLGWISGESVGYVWPAAGNELKINSSMSRRELQEAHRVFYTNALARKWAETFHTETGPMWDKLIPAQSSSSTSFAHPLTDWGVRFLGIESAAVQPMFGMRIAFTRGAARQYGGNFLYYHAPNFGDTATTFTKAQNFAGPDHFYHSRYGTTMGPSLSWYRKSYYLYYMAGASAIYLEQGFDQFFKPGPGVHPFQLNPYGRITQEFIQFVEKHPNRGTPYTPIAILLDPAHGWEMTDYPHWPFGLSQINRHDRALRQLFGVAYYPGLVAESEPATGDRQALVNGIFGDIFDVLAAADAQPPRGTSKTPDPTAILSSYRAVVVGGHLEWSKQWIQKLTDYVKSGGTVVVNAAQVKGLPTTLIGIRSTGSFGEADSGRCQMPGEASQELTGQLFRYEKLELKGAQPLITTVTGDPLVTVNKVGNGTVIFAAVPDLLGHDDRITPFAAHMLAHVFHDATPVKVRGDVEYLINSSANGWIVTLLNNSGVYKPAHGLAQVDRTAYVTATINVPGKPIESAVDWITDNPVEVKDLSGERVVSVRIAPGAVAVIELMLR